MCNDYDFIFDKGFVKIGNIPCEMDGANWRERRDNMIPVIDKKKTGIQLRRIMDERELSVKDVQQYLGLAACIVFITG